MPDEVVHHNGFVALAWCEQLRVTPANRPHLDKRLPEIEREITGLREFAQLKPQTKTAEYCSKQAAGLEHRLSGLLARWVGF